MPYTVIMLSPLADKLSLDTPLRNTEEDCANTLEMVEETPLSNILKKIVLFALRCFDTRLDFSRYPSLVNINHTGCRVP